MGRKNGFKNARDKNAPTLLITHDNRNAENHRSNITSCADVVNAAIHLYEVMNTLLEHMKGRANSLRSDVSMNGSNIHTFMLIIDNKRCFNSCSFMFNAIFMFQCYT